MTSILASEPIAFADMASRSGIFTLGLFLALTTFLSMMRTVIVPRPLKSSLTGFVMLAVYGASRGIAAMRRTYRGRDKVMAWTGPVMIMSILLAWLVGFLFAYAMLIYGISGMPFGQALRQSGSSLLTLGFAGGNGSEQTAIDFIAATTGPILIAMMIGYLPTIFQTYLDREVLVTMFSTTAGEPSWGPEYLARSSMAGTTSEIASYFRQWSEWAAKLRLTHLTYPTLIYIRGSRAHQHYVTSLLAAMDAAAMHVSVSDTEENSNAYRLLLQGSQTFEVLFLAAGPQKFTKRIPILSDYLTPKSVPSRPALDIPAWNNNRRSVHAAAAKDAARGITAAQARQLGFDQARVSTLTREQFDHALSMLKEAHVPIVSSDDDAWEMFSEIRKQYEYPAYGLAYKLDAVPAPWSGPRFKKTPVEYPTSVVEVRSTITDPQPPTTEHP